MKNAIISRKEATSSEMKLALSLGRLGLFESAFLKYPHISLSMNKNGQIVINYYMNLNIEITK